jgi:hypothetical protein
MEHLYEFWDFFKRFKKKIVPEKYEGNDFMYDLFEIVKNRLTEDKVIMNSYSEEGHKVFEALEVGKTVFFVGSQRIPMNTKFIIKNIEGDKCYAWRLDKFNGLYHLPLVAFSETQIVNNGMHVDVDPLGEEDWEDDNPGRPDLKNVFLQCYPFVIKVNKYEYIKYSTRVYDSGCFLDITNQITRGKPIIENDKEFDKMLKYTMKKHSHHRNELSYTSHYTLNKENYKTIIEELRNNVETL